MIDAEQKLKDQIFVAESEKERRIREEERSKMLSNQLS